MSGIGRKIRLKIRDMNDDIIIDYDDDSYIEEGEFLNDDLNGTFGRRI